MPNTASSREPSHIAESIGRIRRQVKSFACLPELPSRATPAHGVKRREKIKDTILFRRCRELLSGKTKEEPA